MTAPTLRQRAVCRLVAEEMLSYVAQGLPVALAATLCTRHNAQRPGAGVNSPGRPRKAEQ